MSLSWRIISHRLPQNLSKIIPICIFVIKYRSNITIVWRKIWQWNTKKKQFMIIRYVCRIFINTRKLFWYISKYLIKHVSLDIRGYSIKLLKWELINHITKHGLWCDIIGVKFTFPFERSYVKIHLYTYTFILIWCFNQYMLMARILVQVTINRRLLIGRDGHLDRTEAYDLS